MIPGGSWDEVTILYIATVLGDTFRFGTRHDYNQDGSKSITNQKWIERVDGLSSTTAAVILDGFYSALPDSRRMSVVATW